MHLRDECGVHDERAMHAEEARGIEALLDAAQRPAQERSGRGGVQPHVVAGAFQLAELRGADDDERVVHRTHGCQSIEAGHLDVQECDVRLQPRDRLGGLDAVRALGNDLRGAAEPRPQCLRNARKEPHLLPRTRTGRIACPPPLPAGGGGGADVLWVGVPGLSVLGERRAG